MAKSTPIIASKSPITVKLEGGQTYYWCRCGQSKTQPFCDGSHVGTDIMPLNFIPEEDETVALCQCKATANAPFCDGAHISLSDLLPGDPAPRPTSDIPVAEPTIEEPTVARIHQLARDGLSKLGHHGEIGAMGVPRNDLPLW
ncbi:MAG: CDGSH iron-sulfur domain-containing protein, partial [Gammaproteobacteria bacterium]|nr:CDGSH iron-sulfur domain-containing protein [Gammaproteobacteria bacterium]